MKHPMDAWMDAIPDDVYAPCPCGCGRAFRYIVKGGESEIKKHAEAFYAKYEAEHKEAEGGKDCGGKKSRMTSILGRPSSVGDCGVRPTRSPT